MGINPLSRKRTSSSSHKVRVVLSSKKEKKIIKAEKVVMLTKQIKQETKMIIAAMSIRQIALLSLQT